MKQLLVSSIAIIALILIGCPYDGSVALTTYEEAEKLEKSLIGEWVAFKEDGTREELFVEKGNKTVYFVNHKRFNEKSQLTDRFNLRSFASDVGGTLIYTIEKEDGTYNYCKYEITSKNEFNIALVDADYMESNFSPSEEVTAKELTEFFSEHIDKEGFFTAKLEFYRKHSPEYKKVRIFMENNGF